MSNDIESSITATDEIPAVIAEILGDHALSFGEKLLMLQGLFAHDAADPPPGCRTIAAPMSPHSEAPNRPAPALGPCSSRPSTGPEWPARSPAVQASRA